MLSFSVSLIGLFLSLLVISSVAGAHDPPFYPHYPSRRYYSLDDVWHFGWAADGVDPVTVVPPSSAFTTRTVTPLNFDWRPPGISGPRTTVYFRQNITIQSGHTAVLYFAACAFYCRVIVDGETVTDHRAGGYVPFQAVVGPSNNAIRDLIVVANNENNSTRAPVVTGGDFYFYGGIHRNAFYTVLSAAEQPPLRGSASSGLGMQPTVAARSLQPRWFIHHVEIELISLPGSVRVAAMLSGIALADLQRAVATLSVSGVLSGGPWKASTSSATLATNAHDGLVLWPLRVAVPATAADLWWPKGHGNATLHNATVTVTIASPSSVTYEDSLLQRFGLRTISTSTVKSESGHAVPRIAINGQAIRLHGFNRHTLWPDTGSALTLEQHRNDVELFHELNVNFIRGAHYPQDQRYLDLLDEAGILLWEEALGPGTKVSDLTNPYFMRFQIQQLNQMMDASFNHPSVIIWAFFNEGPSDDDKACAAYTDCANAIKTRSRRLVSWASNKTIKDKCLSAATMISFNSYPGWYQEFGNLSYPMAFWSEMSSWSRDHFPNVPLHVSETGGAGILEYDNKTAVKWSTLYQEELIVHDVEAILLTPSLPNIHFSGLTLWQFSDIDVQPRPPSIQCDYIHGIHYSNWSTPHDCAYIDVDCSRPGGMNHKGSVDMWRRRKPASFKVEALYAHVPLA